MSCSDDGPGAEDLAQLNVVFVTGKKDGLTQRGRMGRGFKELLSIATHAACSSCGRQIVESCPRCLQSRIAGACLTSAPQPF